MKYIAHGTKYNTIDAHVNAPLFKRVFDCDDNRNAKLSITAVGLYRLFLNGKELNKSYFAPCMSNPDQIVFRDVYDVENELKEKDNVLCVLLGNGFANSNDFGIWMNETAPYRTAPKFALSINSGERLIVETDERFLAIDSPITFDDFRCGERYDARLEIDDVLCDTNISGFCESVIVEKPQGEIVLNNVQPIALGKPQKASSIKNVKDGWFFDFGVNDTGVCRLQLADAVEGQRIDLFFAEDIDADGNLDCRSISFDKTNPDYNQHDVYICKGGKQTYVPSFTWHGFRYCLVKGLNAEQVSADAVTFLSTHSALSQTCDFYCDNKVVNKLVKLTLRSDISNFVFYPYDCPHREKNGWTADAALSAEQMLFTFDAKDSLEQWLLQIRHAQRVNGELPGIIPTAGWGFDFGNGPAWDSVLVELPYQIYRFYGDKKVVLDNASAIEKYFSYAETKLNDDGLANFGLGDWVQTYTKNEGDFETPVEITDTLTLIDIAKKTVKMFECVNLSANGISDFAQRLLKSFRAKYIVNGKLTVKTQTALAMALQTGVFLQNEASDTYGDLLNLIHGQGDHFRVGVVGYKYLFDTLATHGDADLCFKLITQKSFPSYGYWVEQHATTLWESFEEYRIENGKRVRVDGASRIPSFNHHFWGGVLAWFYKNIGWLNVVDSNEISIKPTFIDGVNAARIKYKREGTEASISWRRDEKTANLVVDVVKGNCLLDLHNRKAILPQGKHDIVIEKITNGKDTVYCAKQ